MPELVRKALDTHRRNCSVHGERSMRLVASFALLALATAATAQTAPPRPMISQACRTEVMTLCPATGDRDARRTCMMANRNKLSDGCKKEMAAMRAARQAARGGNGDMAAPGAMTPGAPPK
jgi:hypothetical protein